MSIDRLVRYIQANGPITLNKAMTELHMGNFGATKKDLYAYAAQFGRVGYDKKTGKWAALSTKPSAQYIPTFRPLKYNLFANVRPDGMTFRALPSRFGRA